MSEWVKVSDRMPEDDGEVLVVANDIIQEWVQPLYFDSDVCEWYVIRGPVFPPIVTHWMNYPEPPNENP